MELLVVISVTAVLLAVLIPAFARAKMQTKGIRCISNLRQMVISADVYSQSYDDHYPVAYYMKSAGDLFISYAWDFTTVKDWSISPPSVDVKPGLLWEGKTIMEIHQCPCFDGGHNWMADPYTGYNYNTSYIGHGGAEAIPEPAKTSQVKRPSETAIFGDGQYVAGANKFMRAPFKNTGDASFSGRSAGTQGYRHFEKTNVAFCDGHAQDWEDCFTETYEFDKKNIAPGTGFLSPDNSMYDLK